MLVAHRNILIQQISEKLAAFGLDHDTISTEHTRRRCMLAHRPHGRNYIRRGHATRRVASIASLVSARRHGRLEIDTAAPWLIVIDEAHHVVPDNQWGQLREIFKNARIVGFTATPARMDGESLHVSKGGLFERLVQAEALGNDSVRVLIERGYLSDFVCYAARLTYNPDDSLSPDELYAQLEHDLTLEAMGEATVYRGPRMIAPRQPVAWTTQPASWRYSATRSANTVAWPIAAAPSSWPRRSQTPRNSPNSSAPPASPRPASVRNRPRLKSPG
ncbi:DEAD/DEAH box helicase [Azorhizophilus paspali]|uniref:DEAD/DEAH box helicase n=1 Tax=Azorhizophilus paspali TaxID=69963 RepID=UPI00362F797C